MSTVNPCRVAPAGRRRVFWTTRADACGSTEPCPGDSCGRPGLQLLPLAACDPPYAGNRPVGCGPDPTAGVTIAADNYVEGLILNIMLTDGAVTPDQCGVSPGSRGGHWSDGFRGDGLNAGTAIRRVKVQCGIDEALREIEALAENDLAKLVQWGIASEVAAEARYAGRNRVHLAITVRGERINETRVAITGERLKNAWVWDTQRAA